jgi:transcriptional regulator with XRE-family HTH domain
VWRDTGNSRYLADTFRRDPLPLTDCGSGDTEGTRESASATGKSNSSGNDCLRHKRKISYAYLHVNEAFAAPPIRAAYNAGMPSMLGKLIKQLRTQNGLTQKALAKKLGLTAPSVTYWERGGGIEMENLRALAKELGVPVKTLVEAMEADSAARLPDSNTSGASINPVSGPDKEIKPMGDSGLGNLVLKDLLARMERIEHLVLDKGEGAPEQNPRKRRKV